MYDTYENVEEYNLDKERKVLIEFDYLILIYLVLKNLLQHCVKNVRILSYSGAYFPAFGLNTPYLSIFSPNAGIYGPE